MSGRGKSTIDGLKQRRLGDEAKFWGKAEPRRPCGVTINGKAALVPKYVEYRPVALKQFLQSGQLLADLETDHAQGF